MKTNPIEEKRKRGRPSAKKQLDLTAVLDIALRYFADKGFEGTRMKDIAEEAGCNKSLMNYHFSNKENLWKQAIMHLGGKMMQRFEEVKGYFKDLEGLAALKAYTRQFVYFSAEHPEFYKVVFHEMCTKTERATWLIDHILAPAHQLIESANTTETDGLREFEGYSTPSLFSIIIGAANVFFIHAFQMEKMYGINPFDKAEIEKHADTVIDLVFAKFSQ